ncbi:MAG: bifunctional [glutamate--ammonia ligase]-adenylyl-L-tyrosine phosphorylase/[glutamate--ammonia-ligase] adenylyltransferase, partial [Pseudomonadota bacterium]
LVYPGPGQTDGRRAVDHQLFFQRTGQLLIRLLDAVTADGQAYRVDTRLRPFGDSGALAISLASLDLYLQQHGRDWERYAWVKARAVTGTEEDHAALASVVRPFVFRGYVDYGVLVSLRDMKQRISREVERQDRTDDVKLGAGGIREVEFVVQSYQLLRGGRDRTLRSPQLGTVLPLLAERGLLSRQACRELDSGYEFLRRTENRLQAVDDKQTHTLPADASDLARLALSMGFEDAAQFSAALGSHRERVASHFEALAFAPSERPEAAGEAALAGAWEGSLAADAAEQALTELGFADAPAALAVLRRMREGGVYRRLDGQGARRLDALMPNLLAVVAELGDHQQRTLERMVNIIEAIGRRSAYVALLNENPPVLGRLVDLIASSAWIADQVAALPLLLDELIDPQIFLRPPNRTMLRQDMVTRFTGIAPEDLEAQMEALRQFQQAAVFQVAVADLSGELPLMSVSDRLTDIAELVLKKALELAQWQLRERHGVPRCGADGREAGFAIIAYGKLGGFELGYGSDLDLVFVHNSTGASQQSDGEQPLVNERYFVRLAQRLLHILSTQTRSGKLYEVDTRLRPSGKGGALVTSLAGFERYQHEQAWVWEHQALLRTRAVAGNPVVCAAYERIRRQTLTRPVEESSLRAEVVKMRKRMRSELDRSRGGAFDIKQGAGGLTDIEFLVQFLVLKSATDNPHLVTHSDNIRQLHDLADSGLLADADAVTLIECYRAYRQRMHRLSLAGGNRLVPEGEVSERRRQITQLWQRGLGEALGVE